MKHILIVGRKFSSLTEYLKTHNYRYTFLQDRRLATNPEKRLKNRVVADFSNTADILKAIAGLKQPIDGAITPYENYVRTTAWIAHELGIPGLPLDAAEACTDKNIMRTRFATAPKKISPDFQLVNSQDDVIAFAKNHQFPLILKPTNLVKSLLVTKSNNLEELVKNYQKSVSLAVATYQKYAPHQTPQLLIEEYLDGKIYSVDAFVDSEGTPKILEQIVDYETGYEAGYNDNFHYSRLLPTQLNKAQISDIRECAALGVQALNMKNSAAHIEIILTKDGPRIVEIGARNGGYRERMHGIANGIDILGAGIATILGKPVAITATRNHPIAVIELFPKQPGIFSGISNEHQLHSLPSINYVSVKAKPGEYIGKSSDGYKMACIVILSNKDSAQFARDLAFVKNSVVVQTSPQ